MNKAAKFILLFMTAAVVMCVFMPFRRAAEAESTDKYVRFTAEGNDPITYVNFTGKHDSIDPDVVRYAKIMYRTGTKTDSHGAELTGQFFISPASQPAVPIKWNHSGQWETVVVDLRSVDAESGMTSIFNSQSYVNTHEIRFDPLESNKYDEKNAGERGQVTPDSYIDIAWIAFFERKSDANSYNGKGTSPYCVSDVDCLASCYNVSNVRAVRFPESERTVPTVAPGVTDPRIPAGDGFAVLEVVLHDNKRESNITKEVSLPITYTLRYDGVVLENQTGTIKGRGNYTFTQPKRPYQIKCDKKTDWFGFGKAKKWILLANITDQTHLRNQVAFYLAAKFDFAYTPETRPVHLYINGNYCGLYLITEKVEIDKNRLDIDYRKGDCLLEIDNNYGGGELNKFSSAMGNLYVVKDPDDENINEAQLKDDSVPSVSRIMRDAKIKINNFENALMNGKSLDEIGQYMDVGSLVDWFIFNEIMKNDDTLFNSSIYLYNDSDGTLHMGPVWDYDLAMAGIDRYNNMDYTGFMFADNYWGRPNWFDYLLNRSDFMGLVSERWTSLYSQNAFGDAVSYLDAQATILEPEYKFDREKWNDTGVFVGSGSYKKAVSQLKDFLVNRVKWLNSQLNPDNVTPDPYTPTPAPSTPAPTAVPSASAAPPASAAQEDSANSAAPAMSAVSIGISVFGIGVIIAGIILIIFTLKKKE